LLPQNTSVPTKIKIDTDDDEDVGNITEPLVAFRSSVKLEDQDVSNSKCLYFVICILFMFKKKQSFLWLVAFFWYFVMAECKHSTFFPVCDFKVHD
jgi:hypothetical protein